VQIKPNVKEQGQWFSTSVDRKANELQISGTVRVALFADTTDLLQPDNFKRNILMPMSCTSHPEVCTHLLVLFTQILREYVKWTTAISV
jgi:hypothetical protein